MTDLSPMISKEELRAALTVAQEAAIELGKQKLQLIKENKTLRENVGLLRIAALRVISADDEYRTDVPQHEPDQLSDEIDGLRNAMREVFGHQKELRT